MGLYSFTDTTEQPAAATLPAEAMSINGTFIENEISGYRTLYVKGRELIGNDIESYQVGNTPGAYYRQKRLLSRTITVGYQLLCEDEEDFRDKYNELNAILNFEQAQLIFADEPDKYFVGTRATNGDVPAGRNNVTGEFTILCADPYKYALATKTVAFTEVDGYLAATIANNGTVAVPIDYSITNNSENGFIGVIGANGAMQYGYMEEADTETATKSETLVDLADGAAIVAEQDTDIHAVTEFNVGATAASYTFTNTYTGKTETVMRLTNRTPVSGGYNWQGCGRVLMLSESAKDFTCGGRVWFQGATNQCGLIDMSLIDTNGNRFARILLTKFYSNSIVAQARYSVTGNSDFKVVNFNTTNDSGGGLKSKPDGAIIQVQKSGAKFTFNFSGTKGSITVPDLDETECAKVAISILYWAKNTSIPPVSAAYWKSFQFVKNNVEYERDIPNRYQDGDVLTIKGSEAKAYKNGEPCLDDEIIGTEYFKAEPGNNVINITESSWAQSQLTATATIREAWI